MDLIGRKSEIHHFESLQSTYYVLLDIHRNVMKVGRA